RRAGRHGRGQAPLRTLQGRTRPPGAIIRRGAACCALFGPPRCILIKKRLGQDRHDNRLWPRSGQGAACCAPTVLLPKVNGRFVAAIPEEEYEYKARSETADVCPEG